MKAHFNPVGLIAAVALLTAAGSLASATSHQATAVNGDFNGSQPSAVASHSDQQSTGTAIPSQGPPWKRLGVVLDLGNKGDADDKNIESPVVLRQGDGTYVMWYRGQTYADRIGRIMRATSPDGLKWTRTGVVMVPTTSYEGDKIDPMSIIFEDGGYKMWYGAEGYGGCACFATSPDGIHWTRYTGNPVLRKTSGNWDSEGAGGQHSVIKIGDKYYMYYKGYGKAAPGWTFYGLAESLDGTTWYKLGKAVCPDPALGETTTFRNLFAFKAGDYYCIMHTMADYLNLYLCTSKDGKSWLKDGLFFSKGMTPGGADLKWATSPCIRVDGDAVKMWYEGGDLDGRVRTLYAETSLNSFLQASEGCVR